MLKRLALKNYRGFEKHSLELKPLTVLVGRNNAGKTTLVEALRLISVVTERLGGLNFGDPPDWTDLARRNRGVSPSLDGLGIDFRSVCYRYGSPPAVVVAEFESGESVEFFASPDGDSFAVLRDSSGELIRSKGRARELAFPRLNILPQVGPLEHEEVVLSDDYVRRNLSSPLAPRHFRNQLRILTSAYLAFRSLAEETWDGLQVQTLSGARGLPGDPLFLGIRDRDFVAEVANMGHGLQMWLQTMWFLARTPTQASVVLDEPDVYMHPDLQRRMIRFVRDRHDQVLVATHSIEIMAEVRPSEILVIDRERERSGFADSDPGVQALVERLGGIHNIHLARLWSARRCLLVEGKDVHYLKLVHDLLYPDAATLLDDIPNLSIGGWGGWNYAVGSSLFIRNAFGESVTVYCIFDSDHHPDEVIRQRQRSAREKNVQLHIWRRKEIENYFFTPEPIARVINARAAQGEPRLDAARVREQLELLTDEMRDETHDDVVELLVLAKKGKGTKKASRTARAALDSAFRSLDGRLSIVSGKRLLGRLSEWSQSHFGVSLGLAAIIRSHVADEIHDEVRGVVTSIEQNASFAVQKWRRYSVSS